MQTKNTPSLTEINAQIAEHEAQISQLVLVAKTRHEEELSAIIQEVRRKVMEYSISAKELGLNQTKVKSGKHSSTLAEMIARGTKYRGPNDEIWVGGTRGRKPRWLADELAKGRSLADFVS